LREWDPEGCPGMRGLPADREQFVEILIDEKRRH
jgi:hypothetical protein